MAGAGTGRGGGAVVVIGGGCACVGARTTLVFFLLLFFLVRLLGSVAGNEPIGFAPFAPLPVERKGQCAGKCMLSATNVDSRRAHPFPQEHPPLRPLNRIQPRCTLRRLRQNAIW